MHPNVKPHQRYFVGDMVVIKTGDVSCAFNWIPHMNQYKGMRTRIVSTRLAHSGRDWRYEIEADDGRFGWCENCFETVIHELPEFEAESVDVMLNLLN